MKPGITKLGFVRSGALIAVLCIMMMHSTFAEIPLAERRSGYDLPHDRSFDFVADDFLHLASQLGV